MITPDQNETHWSGVPIGAIGSYQGGHPSAHRYLLMLLHKLKKRKYKHLSLRETVQNRDAGKLVHFSSEPCHVAEDNDMSLVHLAC